MNAPVAPPSTARRGAGATSTHEPEPVSTMKHLNSAASLNRRGFLQTLGATTAAAAVFRFAPFVRASDKSGTRPVVVGTGEHQYEVLHDWGQLPEGCVLGNTHSVAEDAQGRIYIKHTVGKNSACADAVLVFDADGRFVKSWGTEFRGSAHGLHLAREGREEFLYLADPGRHLVVKTSLDGREVWR